MESGFFTTFTLVFLIFGILINVGFIYLIYKLIIKIIEKWKE